MVCRSQAILFVIIRMTQKKQSLLMALVFCLHMERRSAKLSSGFGCLGSSQLGASEVTFVKGGSRAAPGTEPRLLSAPGGTGLGAAGARGHVTPPRART